MLAGNGAVSLGLGAFSAVSSMTAFVLENTLHRVTF